MKGFPMRSVWRARSAWLIGLIVPLGAAALTLQTVINGSDHPAMIDVGETQIVLNVWGTLHATGYPHYVIAASALTALLRAIGIDAVTAPALTSWLFGALTLLLLLYLLTRLTGSAWIAAATTAVYGLTRTLWLHHSIAEIYAFTLLIVVGLYALALPAAPIRWRVGWLALLGGIGVAHHRAIVTLIPALLIAAWPDVRPALRRPLHLIGTLALGLIGFAAYIYLPLRAQAGAAWIYGEPGTWPGLWDQIIGREAARFIGAVTDFHSLLVNLRLVTGTLIDDLGGGMVGVGLIAAGLIGLIAAVRAPGSRRAGLAVLVGGLSAYLFHVFVYTDVLAALIQIVTLSLALGWAWLMQAIASAAPRLRPAIAIAALAAGIALIAAHGPAIHALTHDASAEATIALAADAPPGSTLMIAWGTRHFAVGFARDVQGRLPGIALVDHKADFAALIDAGPLVTPDYTFYDRPAAWWAAQIGAPVTLSAAAPHLIAIRREPELAADLPFAGIGVLEAVLTCEPTRLRLDLVWAAADVPQRDQAVFVHLLDATGAILAQADQSAPVYGLRPLTGWRAREIIRDSYALPRLDAAARIRYGLYAQRADGSFDNTLERSISVECPR
jgi:hypothetical protein